MLAQWGLICPPYQIMQVHAWQADQAELRQLPTHEPIHLKDNGNALALRRDVWFARNGHHARVIVQPEGVLRCPDQSCYLG